MRSPSPTPKLQSEPELTEGEKLEKSMSELWPRLQTGSDTDAAALLKRRLLKYMGRLVSEKTPKDEKEEQEIKTQNRILIDNLEIWSKWQELDDDVTAGLIADIRSGGALLKSVIEEHGSLSQFLSFLPSVPVPKSEFKGIRIAAGTSRAEVALSDLPSETAEDKNDDLYRSLQHYVARKAHEISESERWQDGVTFFTDFLAKLDRSVLSDEDRRYFQIHCQGFLGRCYGELEQFDKAAICYDKAIAVFEHHPFAASLMQSLYISRFSLYLNMNQLEQAQAFAQRILNLASENVPGQIPSFLDRLANACRDSGQYKLAIKYYDLAAHAHAERDHFSQKDSDRYNRITADCFKRLAVELQQQDDKKAQTAAGGCLADAVGRFTKIEMKTDDDYRLARDCFERQLLFPDRRIRDLEMAVKLDRQIEDRKAPDDDIKLGRIYHKLALAYVDAGHLEEAIPCLNEALVIYDGLKQQVASAKSQLAEVYADKAYYCAKVMEQYADKADESKSPSEQQKAIEKALEYGLRCLRAEAEVPNSDSKKENFLIKAHGNVGFLFAEAKQYAPAIAHSKESLRLQEIRVENLPIDAKIENLRKLVLNYQDLQKLYILNRELREVAGVSFQIIGALKKIPEQQWTAIDRANFEGAKQGLGTTASQGGQFGTKTTAKPAEKKNVAPGSVSVQPVKGAHGLK